MKKIKELCLKFKNYLKNVKDKKHKTAEVIWVIIYLAVATLFVFLVVWGTMNAITLRDLTGLKYSNLWRKEFNTWRGKQYFVDIVSLVQVFIVLCSIVLVSMLVINDNRAKTRKKKQVFKNLR